MQYGLEVDTYKRIENKNKNKKDLRVVYSPLKLGIFFSVGILLSRISLVLNLSTLESIAPFGIAYILALQSSKDKMYKLLGSSGVILGYLTLVYRVEDVSMYIITSCILVSTDLVNIKIGGKSEGIRRGVVLFLSMMIFKYFIDGNGIISSIVLSGVLTIIIEGISYIVKYSVSCLEEFNTNHIFISEELISISILISLSVAGIGGMSILNISIRNIIALVFILIIAYTSQGALGAAMGISMGLIIGITMDKMLLYVTLYGVCGLVVGVFKDIGKIFSAVCFVIMYSILNLYAQVFDVYMIVEALISVFIFLAIPNTFINKLMLEIDAEKKEDKYTEFHLSKIKEEFTRRFRDFTQLLGDMSEVMQGFGDNNKLLLKNKSAALIENLADRVCSNCDMKYMCWKRELYSTYGSFSELIKSSEEGVLVFPEELEKKCVKKHALIKSTEEIVEKHILNEMWKKRLEEGRMLLANHIGNMADTVDEILTDLDRDMELWGEFERSLKRTLNRNNFKYLDLFCYEDKKGRINIKITLENCHGAQYCVKEALPIINKVIGRPMSIGGDGCSIDPKSNQCKVLIEETPKYHIASYVALSCKEGEKYTGDSHSFNKTKDGCYMTLVSDGMGSGPGAGEESKAAVELIEKFTEAGFNNMTAINAVNSIMNMKFAEDEKYATLDMNTVDLYSGDISFMKIGAVASFIKSGDSVEEISSKTLPFGVLDKVDVDIINRKVKSGDIIITLSDGILEINKDQSGSTGWLVNYLRECKSTNPKEMVHDILEKAKELSGGKSKDDMTVVASKVYSLY